MMRKSSMKSLFINLLIRQVVCFSSATAYSLPPNQDFAITDGVTKELVADRGYRFELNKNAFLLKSYLETGNGRLRRSSSNETLDNLGAKQLDRASDFTDGRAISSSRKSLKFTCGSNPESCRNKCSNKTRFVRSDMKIVPLCGCDAACNDIFQDCCSDYTEHCVSNTKEDNDPVYASRLYLHCVNVSDLISSDACEPPPGVWMITRCPKKWADHVIREKCHAPSSQLGQSYETFVPVYSGANGLTYRNQYCAICHNVTQFEFWSLIFSKEAIPPAQFNKKDLTKFIEKYVHLFRGLRPKDRHPLRYCYFPEVISTCPQSAHAAHEQCVNGTVEIVHQVDKVYRNRACSSCRGVKEPCSVECIEPGVSCSVKLPRPIYRAVDVQHYTPVTTMYCPAQQVFDPHLDACRPTQKLIFRHNSSDSYVVVMTLLKYSKETSIDKSRLRKDISGNFKLHESKVSNVRLLERLTEFVIIFTLELTPLQSLMVATDFKGFYKRATVNLRRIFEFQDPFHFQVSSGKKYTVYRINVRQRTCVRSYIHRFEEYIVMADQRVYVNSTRRTYKGYEYEINTTNDRPNVTVCSKLTLLKCNSSYIKLKSSEYRVLPNLTLIYKTLKYDFGDYTDGDDWASICVRFKKDYQVPTNEGPKRNLTLTVINFVGFVLSVVCLFVLIVTYAIFKELRSLPGKNLLSLAVSLALAELLWLCSSVLTKYQAACVTIAIAGHYFFLVSFTATSVIAFHSCLVFAKTISLRLSQDEQRKKFVIYFLITWGIPALFVLTFALLDHYKLFVINYGGSDICWLGTRNSKLFLFVIPLGALLFLNLLLFVFVAVRLCKNRKASGQFAASDVLRKRNKENVMICIKLSTLLGFSWLFILLDIVLKSETDAFLYLFVIFVGLQGVFIAVAFLFNHKCYGLYRALLSTKTTRSKNRPGVERKENNSLVQQSVL